MSNTAISRVILGHFTKSATDAFKPEEAKEIQVGKALLDRVNLNIKRGAEPMEGIDPDEKNKLMAYIIIRRENPILEQGDHINYESAVTALKEDTFQDEDTFDQDLVKQVNKLQGALDKPLAYDDKKGIIVAEESNNG